MILSHINRSAVNKTQLPEEILHDDIIVVGIDPQVSALRKGPVDAECADSFFRSVSGDSVNDAIGTVIKPRAACKIGRAHV